MRPPPTASPAVADQISGGRAAINVVSGWFKDEFTKLGEPWLEHGERYRRLLDSIDQGFCVAEADLAALKRALCLLGELEQREAFRYSRQTPLRGRYNFATPRALWAGLLANVFDLNIKLLAGYSGSDDDMAIMRKEVVGKMGAITGQGGMVRDGRGRFIIQIGGAREKGYGEMSYGADVAETPEQKAVMNLIASQGEMGGAGGSQARPAMAAVPALPDPRPGGDIEDVRRGRIEGDDREQLRDRRLDRHQDAPLVIVQRVDAMWTAAARVLTGHE